MDGCFRFPTDNPDDDPADGNREVTNQWIMDSNEFIEARTPPLDDIFDLARLQAFNNYLCATVHVAHAHGGRGHRWADDPAAIADMKRKVPETVAACFELIESEMFKGPWVMGETYSLCDTYLYTIARWLDGDTVDTTKLPKTMALMQRMEARPAVKTVLAHQFG